MVEQPGGASQPEEVDAQAPAAVPAPPAPTPPLPPPLPLERAGEAVDRMGEASAVVLREVRGLGSKWIGQLCGNRDGGSLAFESTPAACVPGSL